MTKKSVSVDFMTDSVDFIQDGAYHQNVADFLNFITTNLSKRCIVDMSTFPYEVTFTIFKNEEIIRPDNIYSNEGLS